MKYTDKEIKEMQEMTEKMFSKLDGKEIDFIIGACNLVVSYKRANEDAIKLIEEFLTSEDYIKLDGDAIAKKYEELLNILKVDIDETI